ncbi:MAG: EI24 domain-containing protein [Pseudomonadota bacterium]
MIIRYFLRALNQLDDAAFQKVLWSGIAIALAVFISLYPLSQWALAHIPSTGWGWLDRIGDGLGTWGAAAVVLLLAYFLFPAVATIVMSMFLDPVVAAVETKHYPHRKAERGLPLWLELVSSLQLGGLVLFWNLIALPFYILLLVTAIGPLFLYLAINGYLLGREYAEMVARRHLRANGVKSFRRIHRGEIFLVGAATTAIFMVPLVNLLAPIVGVAMATHLFHHRADEAMTVHASTQR